MNDEMGCGRFEDILLIASLGTKVDLSNWTRCCSMLCYEKYGFLKL